MNALLTDRDAKAIDFISSFGLASTSHLATAVYQSKKSSLRVARRRLSVLAGHNLIHRMRLSKNAEYVYYSGRRPPVRSEHHLLLTEVYVALLKLGGRIVEWHREQSVGDMRPDAYCIYSYGGYRKHIAIEIERNTNPFNQNKYEALLKTWDKAKVFPRVLIISEHPIKLQPSEIKYVVCKPDMTDIMAIVK